MKSLNRVKAMLLHFITFISFTKTTSASIATPVTGEVRLYVDSADGFLKFKDSAGAVSIIISIKSAMGTDGQILMCDETGKVVFESQSSLAVGASQVSGGTHGQVLTSDGSKGVWEAPASVIASQVTGGTDGQVLTSDGTKGVWEAPAEK